MDVLNFGEIVNLLLVLSIAASVAGFMAGLLGVGGGIIMVPALYYAFTVLDFDIATRMHISVGTSLAIIVPTSIISAKTHMEHKAVDVNLVKSFGIFIVLGVIGGTFLAINLRTSDFILFFSIMAFIVGLFFIFFRDKFLENPKKIKDSIKNISGVAVGFISVLLGIGGSGPTKRIPSKTFLKVMEKLETFKKCRFFLATGKNEDEQKILMEILNTKFREKCVALDNLSIRDTLPIIKNCNVAICNDTSFSHLSSALGIKTITLMADTPLIYGSYSTNMYPIIPDGEITVSHNTLGKDKINPDKIYEKLLSIIN